MKSSGARKNIQETKLYGKRVTTSINTITSSYKWKPIHLRKDMQNSAVTLTEKLVHQTSSFLCRKNSRLAQAITTAVYSLLVCYRLDLPANISILVQIAAKMNKQEKVKDR